VAPVPSGVLAAGRSCHPFKVRARSALASVPSGSSPNKDRAPRRIASYSRCPELSSAPERRRSSFRSWEALTSSESTLWPPGDPGSTRSCRMSTQAVRTREHGWRSLRAEVGTVSGRKRIRIVRSSLKPTTSVLLLRSPSSRSMDSRTCSSCRRAAAPWTVPSASTANWSLRRLDCSWSIACAVSAGDTASTW